MFQKIVNLKTINRTATTYQLEDNDIVKETTDEDEIWYLYDESKQFLGLNINGTSYYYENKYARKLAVSTLGAASKRNTKNRCKKH